MPGVDATRDCEGFVGLAVVIPVYSTCDSFTGKLGRSISSSTSASALFSTNDSAPGDASLPCRGVYLILTSLVGPSGVPAGSLASLCSLCVRLGKRAGVVVGKCIAVWTECGVEVVPVCEEMGERFPKPIPIRLG